MPKTFHYPDTNFSCQLVSHRCEATTRANMQCKRRAVIGSSPHLCWNHLLKLKHLRIAPSLMPNAGKGLFALDPSREEGFILFRPKQLIITYGGEQIDQRELNDRYGEGTAPYAVEVSKRRGLYEDGACGRGVGANVNTFTRHQNARLGIGQGGATKLYATKVIRNGDEIYVSYGRGYHGFADHYTR